MKIEQKTIEQINEELQLIKNNNKTMILSTKDSDGNPEVSYAPYIFVNNSYYIIISEIANHFKNININPSIQGMLIDDESITSSLFFRKRLTLNFDSKIINNEEIVKKFKEVHGNIIGKLLEMDFHIVELTRKDARIVLGPGIAYFLDKDEIVIEQNIGQNFNRHKGHIKM